MPPPARRTFGSDFRTFFLRGLAILLPSVLTLWLLWAAFQFVQRNVAEPINSGIRLTVIQVAPRVLNQDDLPSWFTVTPDAVELVRQERARQGLRPLPDDKIRVLVRERNFAEWWNDHWYLRIIGLLVAITLFYLAGVLLGGFIGRRIYHRVESLMTRLPLIKQVYPSIKQVVDFLLGDKNQITFNRVVVVEYPRKGVWTLGFHTGPTLKVIDNAAGVECVSVFIPSSPTPFTGYAINLPRDEVFDVNMTIDEALRFVVSGGVLVPDHLRSRPVNGAAPAAPLAGGARSAIMPLTDAAAAPMTPQSAAPSPETSPEREREL